MTTLKHTCNLTNWSNAAQGMQEALSGEIHMKEVSYETVQILVNFSYGQVSALISELF